MTQCDHWVFYYITFGLLCPIYFLLGILGPFTFLGHPWSFLILCSHGLLLTHLGFPDPITLSFILRAHGLSISPWLSLLALFRACCNPFSLFHIAIANGFATSLSSGSFRPVCFHKTHLFILWAYDPLLLPLGLNGFSIQLLTLFCLCCWASSFYWTSQNKHQHSS